MMLGGAEDAEVIKQGKILGHVALKLKITA
jgi:hypothetical protein